MIDTTDYEDERTMTTAEWAERCLDQFIEASKLGWHDVAIIFLEMWESALRLTRQESTRLLSKEC